MFVYLLPPLIWWLGHIGSVDKSMTKVIQTNVQYLMAKGGKVVYLIHHSNLFPYIKVTECVSVYVDEG